jgi:hypothetical protein
VAWASCEDSTFFTASNVAAGERRAQLAVGA